MKRYILILILMTILSACTSAKMKEERDIKLFQKLNTEKSELAKEYYQLMRGDRSNQAQVKKLDMQIMKVNDQIRKLSLKSYVQEFIKRQKLQQYQEVVNQNKRNSTKSSDFSADDSKTGFAYEKDIEGIGDPYDFTDEAFMNPTRVRGANEYEFELDNEKLIEESDLIDPEKGFSDQEMSVISGADGPLEMEDSVGETLEGDLEFLEDDFEEDKSFE